jgi:NitT/TauT family transport system substrate-binding protein
MKSKLSLISVVLAVAITSCAAPPPRQNPAAAPSTEKMLTKVRLPMGYIPNVQYAPFYMAVDKGYFAAEGIELEFDYKFETDGVKLVGAGELPFAVVSGEQVVLARSKQVPVKYVMQWYRKYPIAVIASAKANINTPADLKGKTIGLPGFFGATYVGWRAFLNANGLKESDVQQEQIGFTQVAALKEGKKDVVVGYTNNEPIVLAQNGVEVKVFAVSDQVDMVANGLLTSDKVIQENPALIKAMIRALLKGIADTLSNPTEAMQITTKYVEGLKADDPIQQKVLAATIEVMKSDKYGESNASAWETTQNTLLTMGQITEKMDVNSFYTNEFLP